MYIKGEIENKERVTFGEGSRKIEWERKRGGMRTKENRGREKEKDRERGREKEILYREGSVFRNQHRTKTCWKVNVFYRVAFLIKMCTLEMKVCALFFCVSECVWVSMCVRAYARAREREVEGESWRKNIERRNNVCEWVGVYVCVCMFVSIKDFELLCRTLFCYPKSMTELRMPVCLLETDNLRISSLFKRSVMNVIDEQRLFCHGILPLSFKYIWTKPITWKLCF